MQGGGRGVGEAEERWFFGLSAVLLLSLYLSSFYSYVLFHSLIEIATIAVAAMLFILVWHTGAYGGNDYLRLLGIGYASAALIDLVHTLAYKGMNVFPGYDSNLPTQLWIAARYLQAATLFAAPLVVGRRLNVRAAVVVYAAAITALLALIFSGNFPDCFLEGSGLTAFKIYSEYTISAALLVSLYVLFRKRAYFDPSVFAFAAGSIVCTVLSELSFTAFVSLYGFANLVGHFFKLAAFCLLYRAILVTGLKQPFDLIFRELKQAELSLRKAHDTLEEEVDKRTAELRTSEERLRRLNRELRAISLCNQTLMRSEDEQALLSEICRIVCEEAGYRLAWVGYVEHDAARTVRPVAWAGFDSGYIAHAKLSWDDASEQGRGPAGACIRSGRPLYVQDFATDPQMAVWRERALARGYRSGAALPLKDEAGSVFGVVLIYSGQANSITSDELRLLAELAGDLAFGITVLRARAERKKAEQELALVNFAMNRVREAAFLIDANSRFHYVNDHACRALGYSREELLGLSVGDIDPDYPKERWPTHWHELQAHERPHFETRHRTKDGRLFPVEIYANYFDYEGQGYNLALVRDIGERKRAEAQLKLAASVFDHAHEAVTITDADANIVAVNRRFTEITGYAPEEVIGRNPRVLKSGRHDPQFYREMWAAIADRGYWAGEIWNKSKDGRIYPEWLSISSVRDESGRVGNYVAVFADVSERVAAETALLESERRLRFALDAARMLAWERDLETGAMIWAEHPAWALGPEPAGGYPDIVEMVHPEDRVAFQAAVGDAVENIKPYRWEFRLVRTDGVVRWVSSQGMPFRRDGSGRPDHMIGVSQDITSRKRMENELRRLNEDLERRVAERTQALELANRELEAFSYTVSHDLRSPLRAIRGYSQILLADGARRLDAEAQDLLQRVNAGAEKMTQLINDLLDLAKLSRREMRIGPVDLSELARQVVEEFQAGGIGQQTTWIIAPHTEAAGDAGLLRVVLYNLLDNARKYSSKREGARVEFGVTEKAGKRVYFVRDNGAGFDMALAGKLFDPFQRLHSAEEFPGTGIGLASVARIVRRHGGEIWAEAAPGEGASFFFTL